MRANSFNTGIASEHLILSKLYRLELEAYMSQGNKKSVDLRIILENGTPISIDVKSVRGYSSLVVNNIVPERNHFIVFVIYNNKFEDLDAEPDIYVVPSTEIPEITSSFGKEKRVMKGKLEGYKNKWNYLTEDKMEEATARERDEVLEQIVIEKWERSMRLRREGLKDQQICETLGLTGEELEDLSLQYNGITGN